MNFNNIPLLTMKSTFKLFSIVMLLATSLSCDRTNDVVASHDPVEIEGYLFERFSDENSFRILDNEEQLQNLLPDV